MATASAPRRATEQIYCEPCYTAGRKGTLAKWYAPDDTPMCDGCRGAAEIPTSECRPVGGQFYPAQNNKIKYVPKPTVPEPKPEPADVTQEIQESQRPSLSPATHDSQATCPRCHQPKHRGGCKGLPRKKRKVLPAGALQPITRTIPTVRGIPTVGAALHDAAVRHEAAKRVKTKPGPKTAKAVGELAPGFAMEDTTRHEWQLSTQRMTSAAPEMHAILEKTKSITPGDMFTVTPPKGIEARHYRDRIARFLRSHKVAALCEMSKKLGKVGVIRQ